MFMFFLIGYYWFIFNYEKIRKNICTYQNYLVTLQPISKNTRLWSRRHTQLMNLGQVSRRVLGRLSVGSILLTLRLIGCWIIIVGN